MCLSADSLFAGLQGKVLERDKIYILRDLQWKPDLSHPESKRGIDFVESDHFFAETLEGIHVEIGEWETVSRNFLQHHRLVGVPKLWEIKGLDTAHSSSISIRLGNSRVCVRGDAPSALIPRGENVHAFLASATALVVHFLRPTKAYIFGWVWDLRIRYPVALIQRFPGPTRTFAGWPLSAWR